MDLGVVVGEADGDIVEGDLEFAELGAGGGDELGQFVGVVEGAALETADVKVEGGVGGEGAGESGGFGEAGEGLLVVGDGGDEGEVIEEAADEGFVAGEESAVAEEAEAEEGAEGGGEEEGAFQKRTFPTMRSRWMRPFSELARLSPATKYSLGARCISARSKGAGCLT